MLNVDAMVAEVQFRYLADTASTLDPTATQLDTWVRQAIQFYLTVLPPVKIESAVVTANREAAMPQETAEVFFVARGASLLFPHQWMQVDEFVAFKPGAVASGDDVTLYYTPSYDIASAAEFDTDCIFGRDWCKEIALVRAGMYLQRRDSKRSPGRGATREGQAFRVDQSDANELYAMMKTRYEQWFQKMRDHLQTRLAFGDAPMRDSPLAGFVNNARVISPLDPPGRQIP